MTKRMLCTALTLFMIIGASAQPKDRGYFNITQFGWMTGDGETMKPVSYLSTTNGFLFNPHWAAGIGAGVDMFSKCLYPLFADVRYTLWDKAVSPFFTLKTGYALKQLGKKRSEYPYNQDVYYRYSKPSEFYFHHSDFWNCGGLMFHPEAGISIYISENANLLLSVAYRHLRTRTKLVHYYNDGISFDQYVHKEIINRLSLGVAIMFK